MLLLSLPREEPEPLQLGPGPQWCQEVWCQLERAVLTRPVGSPSPALELDAALTE